ncbi:unnamed protein product [Rotaria sordida]|uniref:Guanosine-3',5'-bis(diphosphate) 3'-pyrophosphohydrolase MESH1 n=1 Tax=Rotaria sordida TaxID=392033 RepID=A0A813SW18_9BILA|nr:unnamed protein product [Rotaria sordida]CAF0803466.1 unnamed protein product [Rotaria sordida]CAF0811720.1 unnamed protein product [Rotaria sordida]
MEKFMHALQFAAYKHRFQKRKDLDGTPYINHPIGVAYILSNEAGIKDFDLLAAALLHDTIEDTETTLGELEQEFGPRIAGIVAELTDDKNLPKAERKRLQIVNAGQLTSDAIVVRLADKIYNLRDLNRSTPVGWSEERVEEYFQWSSKVARQLFGHNVQLDTILKDLFLQRNIRFD